MRTVVRTNGEKLHGPRFAPRQLAGFNTWKHSQHSCERLLVIGVIDARPEAGWVRGYGILKRAGEINQPHASTACINARM
jgi:hypothetical protein